MFFNFHYFAISTVNRVQSGIDLKFCFKVLLIDLKIDDVTFNSIEWSEEEDKILLHIFEDDDYDYFVDFDELEEDKQRKIYVLLSIIYN